MLVYLVGYMGCGKSSIGRKLARRLGMDFIDMDSEIIRVAGKSVGEVFAEVGEEGFRLLEKEVLKNISEKTDAIVATGGGSPCFFDNMDVMNRSGLTIYFKMGAEKLAARLEYCKDKRPLIKDKTQEELVDYISVNLKKRDPYYMQAKLIIDGDKVSDEYIADHIAMYLMNKGLSS